MTQRSEYQTLKKIYIEAVRSKNFRQKQKFIKKFLESGFVRKRATGDKYTALKRKLPRLSSNDVNLSINKIKSYLTTRRDKIVADPIRKYAVSFHYTSYYGLKSGDAQEEYELSNDIKWQFKYLPVRPSNDDFTIVKNFDKIYNENMPYYDGDIDNMPAGVNLQSIFRNIRTLNATGIVPIYGTTSFINGRSSLSENVMRDIFFKENRLIDSSISKIITSKKSYLKKNILMWVMDIITDIYKTAREQDGAPYLFDVFEYNFDVIDITDADEKEIRMYNVSSKPCLEETIETDSSCVEKFFIETFKIKNKRYECFSNTKSKYFMSLEKLREIGDAEYNDERKLWGYTVDGVKKICMHYNFNMKAYNVDYDLLDEFITDNKKFKLIISFMVRNNHFYYISAKSMRFYDVSCFSDAEKHDKKKYYYNKFRKEYINYDKIIRESEKFNPKIKPEIDDKREIIILNDHDFIELFNKTNFDVNSFTLYDNDVGCIIIDNKKYFSNKTGELGLKCLIEIYKKLNMPINKKISYTDIAARLVPDYTSIKSDDINQIFEKPPLMSYVKTTKKISKKKLDKATAIDINGHYRNCLCYDFYDYGENSKVEKYTDDNSMIEEGIFYGFHSLLGWVWCPFKNDLVDIKYIIVSNGILKNTFPDIIQKISNVDNEIEINGHTVNTGVYKKLILNCMVGLLNKKNVKNSLAIKSEDKLQNGLLVKKGWTIGKNNIIFKTDNFKLLRTSNHIRFQIIWYAFKNLEKLMNNFKEIYSIKTDSVFGILNDDFVMDEKLYKYDKPHIVYGDKNYLLNSSYDTDLYKLYGKLGDLKFKFKNKFNDSIYKHMDMNKECSLDDIKNLNQSCFIYGKAGYGKSYTLCDIMLYKLKNNMINLNNSVLITNTNVNIIELKNCFNELSKSYNCEYDIQCINYYNFMCCITYKWVKKLKYIFLDEVFTMSCENLACIMLCKVINPDIIIVGNGDYLQNTFTDLHCSNLFRLFKYNVHTLTNNYRNDIDCENIDKYSLNDFKKFDGQNINDYNHICLYNKTRKKINTIINNINETQNGNGKKIETSEGSIFIYDDVILRVNKTNHKLGLYNGNKYTYKELYEIYGDITDSIVSKYCILGYCLTQNTVQGNTINNKYVIHDADEIFNNNGKFNRAAKYVSITRCVNSNDIYYI